VQNRL